MNQVFRGWFLLASVCLVVVGSGCASECVDASDCIDAKGSAAGGQQWSCRESRCEEVPPIDAPERDAGVDAGMEPVTCPDGGTPVADGGCPPQRHTAHVRFVNAFSGLKDGMEANAPWNPYKVDVFLGEDKLFSAVEPGSEAVEGFREVTVTPGATLRFTLRDADADASATPVADAEVTLEEGERLTLIGTGLLPLSTTEERSDKPRLLALKESFGEVEPDQVRVRFVAADLVAGPVPDDNRILTDASGLVVHSTVDPYEADPEPAGAPLPATIQRLSITGSPAFVPSQSRKLFFSIPEGTLPAGSAWFAILTGNIARTLADEGEPTLLLVPAGKEGAIRLKRDPLLYFFNGLMPGAGTTAATNLQFLVDSRVVATGLGFGTLPRVAELPVTATGTALRVALSSDASQTVLEAQTGPLEAGSRYLAAVCGRLDESPRLLVVKNEFAMKPNPTSLIRFIHCSSSSPAPLDFGYYTLQPDGESRDVFTPVVTGVDYGAGSSPATGTPFSPPIVTPSSGTPYGWYGIRSTVEGAAIERYIRGRAISTPTFLVLINNWSDTLTFRTMNVFTNTWQVSGPLDSRFSALP